MRVGILAFFLILEEKHSTFHSEYDIGLLYVAFIILGVYSFYNQLVEDFCPKKGVTFSRVLFFFVEII